MLGTLLHLARRSSREDETWKILEPIMLSEEKPFMVLEILLAASFNYLLVRYIAQKHRAKLEQSKLESKLEKGWYMMNDTAGDRSKIL